MRNKKVLTRIGNILGSFVQFDQVALQLTDVVQQVRLIHDVQWWVTDRNIQGVTGV